MMTLFKNKYGEIRSGWSIAAVIIIMVFGQVAGGALASGIDESNLVAKTAITLLYGVITIGGSLVLFKWIYKRTPVQMGLIPKGWFTGLLYGLGIGAVSIAVVFLTLLLTGQATVVSVDASRLLSIAVVAELFSVGIFMSSEEIAFRGYVMTALKTTRNKWVVVLLSSLIFASLHLTTPGIDALTFANVFLVGVLLAYMFVKSGKLWLSIGFHIAWNFLEGDIFGMNVSGNEQAAMFTTKMGTNELLTGGVAGPEGGIITTIIMVLALVYVHFCIREPVHAAWSIEGDLPLI
ncbi:MAG: CPBP family intramembrane metalloprotease [Propionibacteriaceae bacterium]|nr:CPBP family intramembrane metalloprotease [Propionibacteriaceae bacterium]